MRLREITPGMVVHFETKEELIMLVENGLINKCFVDFYYKDMCCCYHESYWTHGLKESFELKNKEITEFSELILPELSAEEAYNKGLNDAWQMAKKIALNENDGGISTEALRDIFDIKRGLSPSYWVFKDSNIQEALAKIEAYEKEQAEIKVGDVVSHDGLKGVVTRVTDDCIYTISYIGTTPRYSATESKKLTKTGKHIDISAILAEIGKE